VSRNYGIDSRVHTWAEARRPPLLSALLYRQTYNSGLIWIRFAVGAHSIDSIGREWPSVAPMRQEPNLVTCVHTYSGYIVTRYMRFGTNVSFLVWFVEVSITLTTSVPKIDGFFFRRNTLLISKLPSLV
jgi:hypothetical protein